MHELDQLLIERPARGRDPASSCCGADASPGGRRIVEDRRQVEPVRLPVLERRRTSSRSTRPIISSIVRKPSSAISSRTSSRDELEEVLDELGLAGELLAQLRILRRDADRARVEMADAHHHAARDDQRRRREAEFLGAEQRRDDDVAAGLHLAVHLDDDAVAEAVEAEHLLRLGEAQLPRHAAVLDARERRRARAAVVARDEHDVRVRLGDAGGDRADAGLGHQLHVHARLRVRVLQIVNQLRDVLDRVDVVMRRRRDQADAGRRVAHLRDPRVDLVAGQLAAFAGLGALRHLDLQVAPR